MRWRIITLSKIKNIFVFEMGVSFYNPGRSQTYYAAQAGLKLASASYALVLQTSICHAPLCLLF